MDESKIKELETKLREMFERNDQHPSIQEQKESRANTAFVIRRRKGQADKRIALPNPG